MAIKKSACILCSRACGITVEVENGNFTRIRGDEAHPMSKGYICQKAARLEHYQNHDDRLTQPLKRQLDGSFISVSWDDALDDIAKRLKTLRDERGGRSFAFYGGGGQANHLGGMYAQQLRKAMQSPFLYSSLAQEKTGDFWLNGRMFGKQTCHTTEDVEHADYVLFIGTNPYQAHGIPNARDTLKAIQKDPTRTMVVVDPRRSETAKQADIHLQLKPGTDAYLLLAILGIIVNEGLHNQEFIDRHCIGFDALKAELQAIPIDEYIKSADVPHEDVMRVARGFAAAENACVRIDLGIQQTLHTTLNGYLEKLLYLITGNFGKRGGNNLHTYLLPMLAHNDERKSGAALTAKHRMFPISGLYPPNILPNEIENEGSDSIRAMFVDSSNPVVTAADTAAYERAFATLDLLVVVDVTLTETARLAHYVLPAASQYEKWEASGFNLEFPTNAFHLREPVTQARGECLPEAEIYTRILEKMQELPTRFPLLEKLAAYEPRFTGHSIYLAMLGATISLNRQWAPYAASIMYRTLGKTLASGAALAAPLLALTSLFAKRNRTAVLRAGHRGSRWTLGSTLFHAILEQNSGTVISVNQYEDVWSLVKRPDQRVDLVIPEMLAAIRDLTEEQDPAKDYPFILMAGERRSYNANQIIRNPAWRKIDHSGALRMHPEDAALLGLVAGGIATCRSSNGQLDVIVELDDCIRRGTATLPHGYGQRFQGSAPIGPAINRLTGSAHCEPLTKTPFHKYVPVHIAPAVA